ncbi:MAG TPA: TylF/MycF/NovP-related O-methyltransferase [Puia sp.]|nr:TylF/MycF/NovP-related O-methyltransferase [Puia sp.]
MKNLFKGLAFGTFRLFSKIKTNSISSFLISWGYLIRSESLYNKSNVPDFPDRLDLHKYLSSQYIRPEDPILFMEFGVFRGETYSIWVNNNKCPGSAFEGFDTFTGLPEDWGNIKEGSFSAGGKLPDIKDARSKFHVGLIQDTLPEFTKTIPAEKRKVIHIDVDLYNATLVTLVLLQPYLRTGDIIIFDDFFTTTKAAHEFKGFYDFLDLYKMPYKPIFKCRNGHIVIEML